MSSFSIAYNYVNGTLFNNVNKQNMKDLCGIN